MKAKKHHSDFAVRLMEHLVVPTFVLDQTGHVIIWNKSCERLTGIAAADVIGTKRHWTGFYTEERPCLADLVIAHGGSQIPSLYTVDCSTDPDRDIFSAENWCHLPIVAGLRYLAIDAGPIHDEDGKLIAVVETLRDITVQKEAQDKLEVLARQDSLTGIPNRRLFDEYLEAEWQIATGTNHPLALLMIDIDHFKAYNDTLGHLAGDHCLKRIAELISAQTRRECDVCARYGGEEFAVILPRTDLAGAVAVAKRIARAVSLARIRNPGLGPTSKLTMSIGASAYDADNRPISPDELLRSADAALYAAKQSGRACVRTPSSLRAA
ncbi:sensor domain-containing diguanylate cyclase [Jiella pacifica]|uniref:diguanylate cyclase n=1 Tax=Jiella pacifica TaxID=2696469 RepID=A0A6N9TC56_9HYPH|nr:sensor domain-containing diguanylate cyclase [Jiella pacifica]NDW07259.1 diguanylate cyclase [Jiella pacifica]